MSPRARPELRLVLPAMPPEPERPAPATHHLPAFDDVQLVSALGRGDQSVAGAFYDRVRPIVDRTILRILGRRDADHDDFAQISIMALIDSIGRFRVDCPLDAWIATVTAHTVYKQLRRRKIELRIFCPEEDVQEREATSASPENRRTLRSCVERLRGHLDELEPNKAWTYLLHDVCGYDLQEIAKITEVSVAAAQKRLSRGRMELRARINEDRELAELLDEMGMEVGR
jgi:RNA polymerase sigma-70 factor (ECF subfamily)